uniref:Small nuclear ribonucleoprotein Sm D2 n=1 Tax=Moschus moschiferus TaxID=68415 RepID=A0A8C6CNI1_MOSMO
MGLLKKPRSEMIPEKLQKQEEEKVNSRPLSMLTQSVKNNTKVPINCHNKKKLLDALKASDGHCNMVLENTKQRWAEVSKGGKGKKKSKPVNNDHCISKIFLCPLIPDKEGPPPHRQNLPPHSCLSNNKQKY